MPPVRDGSRVDRLAIGPASRLLGVDRATLRRWADDGRVAVVVTVGGHRRFERREIERLASVRAGHDRWSMMRPGETSDRVTRAYRRSYRARPGPGRLADISPTDRDGFRADGRRLVEALVEYLSEADAPRAPRRRASERAAELATDDLAGRLARTGVDLETAVGAFVAARRPFFEAIGSSTRRRAIDPASVVDIFEAAVSLLDRLTIRFIATFRSRTPRIVADGDHGGRQWT